MGRLEVPVTRGASLQLYQAMWGPLCEAVLNLAGSTCIILPIGDPKHGQPNATTFKTVGEEQVTFTWSEAPSSFDTPLDLTDPDSYQGIIPHITFNETDEEADSPDADYWTGTADGTAPNEPSLSWNLWIRPPAADASNNFLWEKSNGTLGDWSVILNGSNQPAIDLYDLNVAGGSKIAAASNVAVTANVWSMVTFTYDGSSAATGIKIYVDGAVVADTDGGSGYTAMHNGSQQVVLGKNGAATSFFEGKIAGGPLGPFFTQKELTADEVLRLYELGRRALAL